MKLGCALGVVVVAMLGAACAPRPDPAADPRFEARHALEAAAERGPVLAIVQGEPFDDAAVSRDALVTQAMADGVAASSIDFTTDRARAAAPDPRLVVALNPRGVVSAALACRAPEQIATAPLAGKVEILAVFCEAERVLGAARTEGEVDGPADRGVKRLLWRAAGRLFPDDYAETYGLRLLPEWLGLGVGGSIGF